MSIALQEPYAKRPIRFLELRESGGWRVKVYGITYGGGETPAPALVARAQTLLLPLLPPIDENTYGAGFIGAHQGRGADFVFIGWWANENELFYRVFIAAHAAPDNWIEATAQGPLACVWDMALIAHERQAWVDCVLANPAGPSIDGYLNQRMNADV